jgi:hypothetical protein
VRTDRTREARKVRSWDAVAVRMIISDNNPRGCERALGPSSDRGSRPWCRSGASIPATIPCDQTFLRGSLQHSGRDISGTPVMRKPVILAALCIVGIALSSVPSGAQAQGLFRGAEEGAARGNRAAGPVGGIVGGAVGAGVGTVNGALGIGPRRYHRHHRLRRYHRHYR